MTVGQRIKRMRQLMGLSQVELADKIGVSKQTLYKYEQGIVTNIPSDKIELLARCLGTAPSELMGWDEEKPRLPMYYTELLAYINTMNEDGLKRLLAYAEDIQDRYRKEE